MATATGPGRPEGAERLLHVGWVVLFAGLLVFLLLIALERALAMVFVLNFSTEGPGATVFLTLLFLSAFAYPLGLHRMWPHDIRLLDWLVLAAPLLVLLSLFPAPAFAAGAALLAFAVATPLLFTLAHHLRGRFAEGAALGLFFHGAGRVWLDTAPFAALASGWLWATVAAVASFAVWMLFGRGDLVAVPGPATAPRPHLITPFLFLMYAFLGMPVVIAAWLGAPFLAVWGASLIGLLLGLLLLRLPHRDGSILRTLSSLVLIIGLLDLLVVQIAPLVAYPLALAASLYILAADLDRAGPPNMRRVAFEAGVFQVFALLLLFMYAVAPSWAFLPGVVSTLAHGSAPWFLLGLAFLLVVGVLVPPHGPARPRRAPLHMPEAPFYGAVVLAALVAIGGIVAHEGPVTTDAPDAPPIRVATYNVHQFFSSGQTGHYNLEVVAQVIEASGAHVIGLQETQGARVTSGNVDGVRWLAHRLDMYHDPGPPASEQVYGVALLSQYPILESEWIHLPAEESVERTAMRATVDTAMGPVPVFVTHLQTEAFPGDRIRQTTHLIDWVRDTQRAWVLGDFNSPAGTDDPAYDLLSTAFTDAWVASGRDVDTGDTVLDDGVARSRIDHVFLHGPWNATDCRTYGDQDASDHALLACDLAPPAWPDETT